MGGFGQDDFYDIIYKNISYLVIRLLSQITEVLEEGVG